MLKRSLLESPKRSRPGLLSHILLQSGDTATDNLAIAWIEVESGSKQQPHHHVPEQAYIIIGGQGCIHVGSDIDNIRTGDLIYIPPDAEHFIENTGTEKLSYISVTVPALNIETLYDSGQLRH